MKGTIVVVVAAAVLLAGCEEMAPEVASAPAVSEDVERIRTAMAVPDGVEVVTVSMDAGAVVFTVRNPGVEAGAAQVRRLAVAAADGEVAETFDTPRRRAVVTDDGVQFVEVATFEEVAVSRHRAQGAHVRAEEVHRVVRQSSGGRRVGYGRGARVARSAGGARRDDGRVACRRVAGA